MKNTTGYSLNALVDFDDPIDVLAHLMIGSEGTLGFISEITYRTVADHADKASALILFDDLETACRAVTLLKSTPVAAVELADRAALRSVEGKPGLPEGIGALGPDGAALLVETRAADAAALAEQIRAIETALAGAARRSAPCASRPIPAECARLLERAQGHVPVGGRDAHGSARRSSSRTSRSRSRASPRRRSTCSACCAEHGYTDAIIFGHALEGNLHFVFTQDFNVAAEVERYRGFMDALCRMVVERYDGSLKAEHGTGRNIAPFVELEWGADAYALMREIKRLFDPRGLLESGRADQRRSATRISKNLKPLPAVRPARRQMHRVRLLRAEVPVARAHAVAAPADRRLARDRAVSSATGASARATRDDARAVRLSTGSTPAPPADCARPRARSASRPAC